MTIKNAITLLLVVIVLLGAMLFITHKIRETNNFLKNTLNQYSQQNTIDSLNNEIFILQTQVGKYEMALELLEEQDKASATKFKKVLSTQSE
jgi:predicted PurR-regulated permease PerM